MGHSSTNYLRRAPIQRLDAAVFLVDIANAEDSYDHQEHTGTHVSDCSCIVFAETFVDEVSV